MIMSDTSYPLAEAVKRINRLRGAMIVYSFVPIVYISVCFLMYYLFGPWTAYVMSGLCILLSAFSALLSIGKKLELGFVAKCGLWLTIVALLMNAYVWYLNENPGIWQLAMVFYMLGQVAFSAGACVSMALKVANIAFYVIVTLCSLMTAWHPQEMIAIMSISIVAYPMVISYMSVKWATKEFFKLSRE